MATFVDDGVPFDRHSKYGNLLLKTTYHLIGIVSMAAFVKDDVPFDRHISMATFC